PDRQGAGIGRRLMDAILAAAGERTMLLNATVAGMPLYEKLGFVACGRVRQHQGPLGAVPPVPPGAGTVRAPAPDEAGLVAALDALAFGAPRTALLDRLAAAGRVALLERDARIAGVGLSRPFGRGHLVGPVAAADAAGAQALIAHLLALLDGFVRIDLATGAGALAPWLEGAGLAFAGEAVTMARGMPLACDPSIRHYAIAAQALG
ncbi:MAG: GNAT family N-acetyltransferase, partial [Alphaproteobacteria bacterium]|nr:GNAT family N-acetyltransferase [Alphaproteobacteria bacterium]